jgi:hypothetical protein
MKKKSILFMVILSVISLSVFSQTQKVPKYFQSGYIITLENDTIQGILQEHTKKTYTRLCDFRDEKGGAFKYTPNEIKAYKFIGGLFYIAKEIEIESEKNLVFLEYIFNGAVDIYYNGENFVYYIFKDGKQINLENKKNKSVNNGMEYSANDNRFKGILINVFIDAPELIDDINKIKLNSADLIKIAKKYHKLKNNDNFTIPSEYNKRP